MTSWSHVNMKYWHPNGIVMVSNRHTWPLSVASTILFFFFTDYVVLQEKKLKKSNYRQERKKKKEKSNYRKMTYLSKVRYYHVLFCINEDEAGLYYTICGRWECKQSDLYDTIIPKSYFITSVWFVILLHQAGFAWSCSKQLYHLCTNFL